MFNVLSNNGNLLGNTLAGINNPVSNMAAMPNPMGGGGAPGGDPGAMMNQLKDCIGKVMPGLQKQDKANPGEDKAPGKGGEDGLKDLLTKATDLLSKLDGKSSPAGESGGGCGSKDVAKGLGEILDKLTKLVDSKGDAPKADAPKADAPKADAPKADAPKADAPKADAPKPDAPKPDAPKADAPKADAPKADAPKADAPKADAPKADAPKGDAKADDCKGSDKAGDKGMKVDDLLKEIVKLLSQIVNMLGSADKKAA